VADNLPPALNNFKLEISDLATAARARMIALMRPRPTPQANPTTPVVGIVGLGTMGIGIAQVFAQAGCRVLATDALPHVRDGATTQLAKALEFRVASGKMEAGDAADTLSRLRIVPAPEAMGDADMVIEAVVERLDTKIALFRGLEGVVAPTAVLATNTSSLSVRSVGAGLSRPERLIGLHFFNPAPAMKLVELVQPPGADPRAAAVARGWCEQAGKVVIDAPDAPGFIVNRCARPFYGEALAILEEGRPAIEIDAAMLAAGYRIGPLSLIDLIGADINLAATEALCAAMGGHPRYPVFETLRRQVAKGDRGRKTGRGLVFPDVTGAAPKDAGAIALRIEAAIVNEAGWLLQDGSTTRDDIDRAMILGLNFPKGPFETLRQQGPDRILAELARLEARAPVGLRGRYKPAPTLAEGG
jgi:3-hydroxybutyryl-CoA dehydrogenase